jgi:hypothetical protein
MAARQKRHLAFAVHAARAVRGEAAPLAQKLRGRFCRRAGWLRPNRLLLLLLDTLEALYRPALQVLARLPAAGSPGPLRQRAALPQHRAPPSSRSRGSAWMLL